MKLCDDAKVSKIVFLLQQGVHVNACASVCEVSTRTVYQIREVLRACQSNDGAALEEARKKVSRNLWERVQREIGYSGAALENDAKAANPNDIRVLLELRDAMAGIRDVLQDVARQMSELRTEIREQHERLDNRLVSEGELRSTAEQGA